MLRVNVEERVRSAEEQQAIGQLIDARVGEVQSFATKEVNQLAATLEATMEQAITEKINRALTGFPPIPPPPASPSPSPPPPQSVNAFGRASCGVKWTRRLSKLTYNALPRCFELTKMQPSCQSKLLLLQSLDGDALRRVTPMTRALTVKQMLERLLARVKPNETVLFKKVSETRQKQTESIIDFAARFQMYANDLESYADNRIRDIFVGNLNATWRTTARSLLLQDKNRTLEGQTPPIGWRSTLWQRSNESRGWSRPPSRQRSSTQPQSDKWSPATGSTGRRLRIRDHFSLHGANSCVQTAIRGKTAFNGCKRDQQIINPRGKKPARTAKIVAQTTAFSTSTRTKRSSKHPTIRSSMGKHRRK